MILSLLCLLAAPQAGLELGTEVLVSSQSDGGALRCEPSCAIDGKNIVVSWNDSYGGRTGSPVGVAVGWAISRDGGSSYRFGGYLAPGPGEMVSGADSRLARDGQGGFYLVVLQWLTTRHKLFVYRMKAGEDKWTLSGSPEETSGDPTLDKPAFAVSGKTLAIAYTRGHSIAVCTSIDSGVSWTRPLVVSQTAPLTRTGCSIAINGSKIVVAWNEGPGMKATEVWTAQSTDGGKSFAASAKVRTFDKPLPDPKGYSIGPGQFTLTACDTGLIADSKGVFQLAFCEGAGIGLVSSNNGGSNWSNVSWVGHSSTYGMRFFPSLELLQDRPVLLYYARKGGAGDPLTDTVLWSGGEDIRLAGEPTDWTKTPADMKHAMIQRNFGDYITLASDGQTLVGCWTDGRPGAARIYARTARLK